MFKKTVLKAVKYSAPKEGRAEFGRYDFNECTIDPCPEVKAALHKFIDSGLLNAYPDGYVELQEKIGKYIKLDPSFLRITSGADEAIEAVSTACIESGDKVIIPSPSFGMFYIPTAIQGADICKIPYGKNFEFPTKEVLESIDAKTKLIILCNPNNPTGTLIKRKDIEDIIIKAKGKAVLIDEVYGEFTGESCIDLIPKYDNLFIIKSFSKAWALASARVGYVISQPKNIEEINKVVSPYNVNQFAVVAASASLDNIPYMRKYVEEVMKRSKPLLEKHLTTKGIEFYPGAANFMLIKLPNAEKFYELMRSQERKLVRPQKSPLDNMIRVSYGTVSNTQDFIKSFDKVLAEISKT